MKTAFRTDRLNGGHHDCWLVYLYRLSLLSSLFVGSMSTRLEDSLTSGRRVVCAVKAVM